MTRARAKALAKNLALSAAVITAGLLAIELLLRTFFPVRAVIYQLDDQLLYELIPGARRLFVHVPGNGGEKILVEINDEGFRGDELDLANKEKPRIAVFGDSFIEAEFSRLEDTFVEQLEKQLGGVEAVNAGVIGYGPDQVTARIEAELDRIAPDLAIVSIFVGNDFGELARNKLFRLDAAGEAVRNTPRVGPGLQKEFADAHRANARPTTIRALFALAAALETKEQPDLSKLIAAYIDDSLARQTKDYERYVEQGDDIVDNFFVDTYDADVALFPDQPSSKWKRAAMDALFARLDRTFKAKTIPWIVMIIPDPIDVAENYDLQIDETKYPSRDRTRLTHTVAELAEKRGIRCVNLYDTLTEKNGERLYFRHGDNHWNALGQKRAAEHVATFIRSAGLTRDQR